MPSSAAGPNTDNGGLVPTGADGPDHNHGSTGNDAPTHQHSNATGAGTGGNAGVGIFQNYAGASGPSTTNHTHGTGGRNTTHTHQGGAHAHTQPSHTHQGGAHAHAQNGTAQSSGSGAAHENMPPWRAVGKIVRVLPNPAAFLATRVLFVPDMKGD